MRLLKLRARAFKKIIWGGSKRRDSFFCLGTSSGSWFTPYKPTTHLGEKALQRLLERSFRGTGLQTTVRQVVSSPPTCQLSNPQGARRPQLVQSIQQREIYPGEDWQMDFTQMPVSQGYKYLLFMIDTFTGWIEDVPTWTEKSVKVTVSHV